MKDGNSFKLKKHHTFVIDGEHGSYKIPPLEQLPYDVWKGIANASKYDTKRQIDAFRDFCIGICPEIEKEEIGDYQWLIIGKKYLELMGE